ncbi:MAG TPA: DUF3054 domain-containing protein [Ktedonobacterales bacterium]
MANSVETVDTVTRRQSAALWRTVALVAGDALAFLVFAGVGRRQHGETSGLGAVGYVAWTALPFALGWFAVSPWLGAYRRRLTNGVKRMLGRTELAWVASYPVAVALRLLFVRDALTPAQLATFALVILIANALFLGIWRTAFAFIEGAVSHSRA